MQLRNVPPSCVEVVRKYEGVKECQGLDRRHGREEEESGRGDGWREEGRVSGDGRVSF